MEAALGTGLLVVFLSALGVTVYRGQAGTKAGGDRIRATKIAEQTIEGARDIGTRNFGPGANSLTSLVGAGTKGVELNSTTGLWEFVPISSTADRYTSKLTVTQPDASDPNALDLSVTTSWNISPNRSQTVTINGRVTNWKATKSVGNWSAGITQLGQYLNAGESYSDVAIIGNYAYLTSNSSNTVTVLQNVTTPGSLGLAGTFPIGGAGVTASAIVAKGTLLYVITSDAAAEVKMFNTTTSAVSPVAGPTYDVALDPGMVPTSLSIAGDFLYLGAR